MAPENQAARAKAAAEHAAERRADEVAALRLERAGQVRRARAGRVAAIDVELVRLGEDVSDLPAVPEAGEPESATTPPRGRQAKPGPAKTDSR